MHLIIIRHGETIENTKGICQGHIPGQLTEEGKKQARKAGLHLKDKKIDAIYSSDLARAMDTAKIIASYHPDLMVIPDERLRERNLKEIQGKPFPEDWDWSDLPEDVESDYEIATRVRAFIEEMKSNHTKETIIAVSHGGTVFSFLSILLKGSEFEVQHVKNASISEFLISDKGVEPVELNSIDHL